MSRNKRNERNKLEIKQIFTQNSDLPEIVLEKKQEAYDRIYAQDTTVRAVPQVEKNGKASQLHRHRWQLPKAGGILLACFLVTGCTAVAAAGIFSRWERLQNMDEDTVKQYYKEVQLSGDLAFQSNRPFTQQEQNRYLELKKAYESDTLHPYFEITRLQEGEDYSGEGVCLRVTKAGEENILYLPDAELTDEELLEIIEYLTRQDYAFYETRQSQALAKGNWESRLAAMTDEEIDYYYLAFWTGKLETSDGFCRGTLHSVTEEAVAAAERARYQELERAYEEENLFPVGEAVVIEKPEDYLGTGIAFCRYDSNFYLPDKELTDEELLEIIDFRKKAYYSQYRINEEIKLGYRKDYPRLNDDNTQTIAIEGMPFADTDGKGSLKTLEDAQIGDIVRFGSYEQDNDLSNGKEAIEWYVLDATEETMTLLSVKLLDANSFSSEQTITTWKDSDVRKWLNGYFYETAFSSMEQADILTTVVENTDGGDTEDKIYLLSYQEFLSYFGITSETLMEIESAKEPELQNVQNLDRLDTRIFAEGTEAALANGLWYWTEETTAGFAEFKNVDYSKANGKSAWWLRTADKNGPSAHAIEANGDITSQQYVNSTEGLRPVVQIGR